MFALISQNLGKQETIVLYLYKHELALTTTLSTPYNGSFSINYSPAPSSPLQQLGTSDES